MPNGVDAMATIAIEEGRAARIAGGRIGEYIPLENPRKEAGSQRAQEARMRAGIAKRRQMALEGRMTHGGGGITWGPKRYKGKFQPGAGAILNKPYSAIRAKNKGYQAIKNKGPSSTEIWANPKFPSRAEIRAAAKRWGGSKGKKK